MIHVKWFSQVQRLSVALAKVTCGNALCTTAAIDITPLHHRQTEEGAALK